MTLTLYTNPRSRGRIARWMMEEAGQPYEVMILDLATGAKDAAYLGINPMGKVPALVDGTRIVTECAAICAYMAERAPEAGLAPPPDARHDYYRWLFFAAGPLEQAVTNRALGVVVPADREGMVGYGSYDRTVATLEAAVSREPYLCGERFTAADLYVGAHVAWGLGFKSLPDTEALRSYRDRVTDRPAYRRAEELSNAEMTKDAE